VRYSINYELERSDAFEIKKRVEAQIDLLIKGNRLPKERINIMVTDNPKIALYSSTNPNGIAILITDEADLEVPNGVYMSPSGTAGEILPRAIQELRSHLMIV
jgi:hypothetical protein